MLLVDSKTLYEQLKTMIEIPKHCTKIEILIDAEDVVRIRYEIYATAPAKATA